MSDQIISELKIKVKSVIGKFVDNVNPSNDGGPGDTMERCLGIKVNNLKLPDYGGVVEVKTGKLDRGSDKKSYLTLFHRNPLPTLGFPEATNSLLAKAIGWTHSGLCKLRSEGKPCKLKKNGHIDKKNGHIDETDPLYRNGINGFGEATGRCYPAQERSFRSTTHFTISGYKNGKKASVRGLYLDIEGDFLVMHFDPGEIPLQNKTRDDVGKKLGHTYQDWLNEISSRTNPHYSEIFPVKYELKELYNDYINKLSNSIFCTYKYNNKSQKKVKYIDVYLLGEPITFDEFKTRIKDGTLVVDFDERTTHDHGTKLRLKPNSIGKLFNRVEKLS